MHRQITTKSLAIFTSSLYNVYVIEINWEFNDISIRLDYFNCRYYEYITYEILYEHYLHIFVQSDTISSISFKYQWFANICFQLDRTLTDTPTTGQKRYLGRW